MVYTIVHIHVWFHQPFGPGRGGVSGLVSGSGKTARQVMEHFSKDAGQVRTARAVRYFV